MLAREARSTRGATPTRRPHGATGLAVVLLALSLASGACSTRYKKLSAGGSMTEVFFYDILGQDREAAYYFKLLKDSHDQETFRYRRGGDTFIVDKNIDAIQRLGAAEYARPEGMAQVIELFTEILLEDPSPLARAAAATSLARLGARLPEPGPPEVEDRGDRFLAYARQLDALHDDAGRLRADTPGARQQRIALVRQIGALRFPDLLTTKNAIRLFYSRRYLVDATEPDLREATDAALSTRAGLLVRKGLAAAVEDPAAQVRVDALRGLKALGDRGAVDGVVERLAYESDWIVRLEAIEYLGKVGTRAGVVALIELLDDVDGNARRKARQALTRIAGEDLGWRPSAWIAWARAKDPTLEIGEVAELEPTGDTR